MRHQIIRNLASMLLLAVLLQPTLGGATALGTYQGNGCDGVKRVAKFSGWLGRQPDFMLDFFDAASWQSMADDARWTLSCWQRSAMPRVVFSIPMLPGSGGATLAQGAQGAYDEQFTALAQLLVARGFGEAILRLGWEFNGGWYPWAAKRDPHNWVQYWQRIVTVMRAVPGAAFRFDWCSAQGHQQIPADQVYPGDAYVDIIGQDTYNQTWIEQSPTPQQRWQSLLTQPYGLQWLQKFAAEHGKPMSIPEWATGHRPDGRAGGDDAYFVTQMSEWIARNNVLYHAYWDYPAKDFNGRLSDGSKPAAAAAFVRAFRQPQKLRADIWPSKQALRQAP